MRLRLISWEVQTANPFLAGLTLKLWAEYDEARDKGLQRILAYSMKVTVNPGGVLVDEGFKPIDWYVQNTYQQEFQLAIPLDERRIGLLDKARAGGDLTWYVEMIFHGLITREQTTKLENLRSNTEQPVKMSARDWLEILGKLGHAETILIEAPTG